MQITPLKWKVLQQALADHGIAWKSFMKAQADTMDELKARLLGVEQKATLGGGGGLEPFSADPGGELAALIAKNERVGAFARKESTGTALEVPSRLLRTKAAITSSTTIVQTQRMPGIVASPMRRVWIRDLLPRINIGTGYIETVKENASTNNAGPQYDGSSPSPTTEGAIKNESSPVSSS